MIERQETRHHVTVRHHFLVEVNEAVGIDKQTGVVLLIGGGSGWATAIDAGRFTRMPFMWTWLRLTIMKLARRKNMMSISGMISMRAFLCGSWRCNSHSE